MKTKGFQVACNVDEACIYDNYCVSLHPNRNSMKKKKDIFSKVEDEAREKLNDPDTKGAAQTVLEYIERQRKLINKH